MINIIVIGANGHVGAYTFDYLMSHLDMSSYHLIASGRRPAPYYTEKGIDYIQLDVCNKESFNALPQQDVYAVINLAGIMPASMKGYDPYPYIDINIRGSLNVLEYCREVECKKYIITTTEADLSGYWKPGASIDADLPANFDHGSNYAMYIISRPPQIPESPSTCCKILSLFLLIFFFAIFIIMVYRISLMHGSLSLVVMILSISCS